MSTADPTPLLRRLHQIDRERRAVIRAHLSGHPSFVSLNRLDATEESVWKALSRCAVDDEGRLHGVVARLLLARSMVRHSPPAQANARTRHLVECIHEAANLVGALS